MATAQLVFWLCLFLVAYTYFLYPVLLFFAYSFVQLVRDWRYLTGRGNRRVSALPTEELPPVSLVIAACNEQGRLPGKIANLRQLDYPPEKLEVLFISDGSTDGTNEILRSLRDANIQTVFLPVRMGKPTALNQGVEKARHDILIFSDAATLFAPDAVKNLVRHFSDPKVGVVCGALKFEGNPESQQTEGVYWKYESMLRLMEVRLGATLTASGAIYALRRQCYRPLAADTIIEDFAVPMNARKLGYRVLYDPEAVGTEFAAPSIAGEFTRRVRLAVGSFRSLGQFARIRLDGFTLVAFVSHKLLRWIVPFLLIGLLVSNSLLWNSLAYRVAFAGQLFFYLWAGGGFIFQDRLRRVRYALVGYFLLAMHFAFLVGFLRFLTGRGEATWQRVN